MSKTYDNSEVFGQFGIEEKMSGLWIVFSHYYGVVARPGDTVDFIFTFNSHSSKYSLLTTNS